MELELRVRGTYFLDALRDYAERRLRFSVRRLNPRIKRLRVSVEDVNGPRGGVDKRCRIVADISPSGNLVIEETDTRAHEAVDRAADRLRRNVRRELKRRQSRRLGKVKTDSIRYPGRWHLAEGEV
ncbi:MAG: HPF/RaiA family ribosome-associated protein [Acidobacteriota bacterium]